MDLDDALRELLPDRDVSDPERDRTDDLVAAAKEAWRRRHINSQVGGAVLAALNETGMSYRQIATETGIPAPTAQRWARPPAEDR
jgi:Homeodomain-like domain